MVRLLYSVSPLVAWWRRAVSGTRLGHRRPESRVDAGSPYREVKDRLEVYLGVPLLRGRMVAATGCGQGEEPLKG